VKTENVIGIPLWATFNKWQKECNRVLKQFGITQPQYAMLHILRNHIEEEQRTTQSDLATSAGIDKMTASKLLRGLEELGLVERKAHPTDSRAKIIELTKIGAKLIIKAEKAFVDFDEDFFVVLKSKKKFRKQLLELCL
jgi:DNA-binding MarR family transcriptional regulator